MKNITLRKNINVDKPNLIQIFNLKEDDDAIIKLALFKNSIEFDVTGQTLRLGAKTSKGLIEQLDGFTVDKNNIDIQLKNSILIPGVIEIDLEIKDAKGAMTTASFFITVNQKVLNDTAVEATNEFDTFTKTVDKIESDYTGLRRIIIDENQAASLQDQINNVNSSLDKSVKFKVVGEGTTVPPINGDGSYILPIATKTRLGGVKIGNNLSIDSNGVLSATTSDYDDTEIRKLINETNTSLEDMASDIEELKQGDIEIDLTDYAKKSDLEVKADKSYVDSAIESVDVSSQLTNYATKAELSSKVDKVTGKSLISDSEIERLATLENYDDSNIKNTLNSKADKSELHSHSNKSVLDGITSSKVTEWNNKSTFDGNYNSLANKPTIPAKTSQLNNDSGFMTSIPSEYVTETELNDKGYLTQHQDISHKADKTELHSHTNKTVLDGITSAKITEWNNKSTFSGSYTDLTNKPTIPTKTSQLTNDSGFITSIPSEYVTETELNNKGYLKVSEFEKLTLGYHTDGKIYLFNNNTILGNGVEIGMNGDVIGYIDSANNIILSGALANDTYTVKYEMEDGTYVDIGSLSLGSTPEEPEEPEEPEIINQIPLSIGSDGKPFNGGQGWKTGYRLSGSSGNESALDGIEVTGFIPCKMGDTIYIKGITDDGSHVMGIYDSSFTTVATATNNQKFTLNGSVVSITINSNFSSNKDETNTAYFRISANTIDNNSIITVNQPLT